MKANYFKFGVFLVLSAALLVTAIVILGSGMLEAEGVYFETQFNTAVSGLTEGSSVNLQGLEIGQVESIGFTSEVYEMPPDLIESIGEERLIRVVFSLDRSRSSGLTTSRTVAKRKEQLYEELNSGLRIQLESNLITGQSYLQGTYVDPNEFPMPDLPWQTQYPFVPSVPGKFAQIKESLDHILDNVEALDLKKLFDHIDNLILTTDQAVEDANIAGLHEQAKGLLVDARSKVQAVDTEKIGKQVEDLVANADGAVKGVRDKIEVIDTEKIGQQIENTLAVLDKAVTDANVAALAQEVQGLFAEARVTNKHLQELLARPDKDKELANIAAVVDELNTTLRRVNFLIATQAPRIDGAMENFRRVSDDVKVLSENLKESPSNIILSSPPRKSELLK